MSGVSDEEDDLGAFRREGEVEVNQSPTVG